MRNRGETQRRTTYATDGVLARMRALPVARLVAIFAVLTLLPLALLAFLSLSLARRALRDEVEAHLRTTARVGAGFVEAEMSGLAELADSYAKRPTLIDALEEESPDRGDRAMIRLHLRQLARTPGVETAFVADPSGRLVDIVPATPSIVGDDFSYRDWYQGVTATGRPYVSRAYLSLVQGRPLVSAAAAPVVNGRDGGRRTLGIVVAAYGVGEIDRFVDDFVAEESVGLTVTDQAGVVVADPNGRVDTHGDQLATDPRVEEALRGRSGVTESRDDGVIGAFAPVGDIGWAVVAEEPAADAFAGTSALVSAVGGIAMLLAVVLIVALVLLAITLREHRRTEARLREEEARTRSILEAAKDAFVSVDTDGRIVGWNRKAEEIFGWPRDDALGRPLVETIIRPQDRGEYRRGLERFLASGEGPALDQRLEIDAVRRDGVEFPVELGVWMTQQDDVRRFNAFIRDISERKEADAQLRAAKTAAEEANHAKSEFLSRMSHELRTPLNAILGFGQLLEMDGLEDDQKENVHEIVRGGRHLLDLINEVLDIARIESGNLALSLEPVAISEVVNEAVALIQPQAQERDIEIVWDAKTCEDVHFLADRQRVKQVILNFLANAVKYNKIGGRAIVSCDQVGPKASVAVTDTGEGIAADKLDRLFVPFDRLGADQTDVEGTGLGLALAKSLIDAMGGSLWVDSSPGHGSTFAFSLPMTTSPAAEVERLKPARASLQTEADRSILYIEDNVSNLRLLERVFADLTDVQLFHARAGTEGVELAVRLKPDLILLDLHLPDIDGAEVLTRLKGDRATSEIPVIILTADATRRQEAKLLDAGARAYMSKPIDLRALLQTVTEELTEVAG